MSEAPTLPPPARRPVSDDSLYEVIGGVRVEKPPTSTREVKIASLFLFELELFARSAKPASAGQAVGEMLFDLAAIEEQYRPDCAFVSRERWPQQFVPRTAAWGVVPDLAVEVVSPTNLAEKVVAKTMDYLRAGVRLVWVVYPDSRQVHVYSAESAELVRIVGENGHLDGGGVLPGFRLAAAAVFAHADPADVEPMPSDD